MIFVVVASAINDRCSYRMTRPFVFLNPPCVPLVSVVCLFYHLPIVKRKKKALFNSFLSEMYDFGILSPVKPFDIYFVITSGLYPPHCNEALPAHGMARAEKLNFYDPLIEGVTDIIASPVKGFDNHLLPTSGMCPPQRNEALLANGMAPAKKIDFYEPRIK